MIYSCLKKKTIHPQFLRSNTYDKPQIHYRLRKQNNIQHPTVETKLEMHLPQTPTPSRHKTPQNSIGNECTDSYYAAHETMTLLQSPALIKPGHAPVNPLARPVSVTLLTD